MSTTPEHSGVKRPFQRPVLEATGPDRRARGFYKTADSEDGALAGATLDNAEDVAVAAVRLGYKIAAAQSAIEKERGPSWLGKQVLNLQY
jgi:hypothetical protein